MEPEPIRVETDEERQKNAALSTIFLYLNVAQQRGTFMFHESAQISNALNILGWNIQKPKWQEIRKEFL